MGCGSSSAAAAGNKPVTAAPTKKAAAANHHHASPEAAQHYDQSVAKFYTFGELLGTGSFAKVFAGVRKADGLEVAIKAIDETAKNFAAEDLDVEVEVLLRMHHPNIIKLYEVFESQSHFYMILERVDGGELFDHIIARGHYSEKSASVIMRQVLEALAHLHANNVVHRDLKPENLLYHSEANGEIFVKIADFGLSAIVKPDELLDVACGSPGYVAPEILKRQTYDAKVDLWSSGVILFILLSGFTPFAGGDDRELYRAIVSADFSFSGPEWRHISAEAKDLVTKLLELSPKRRLSAAQALKHQWLVGEVSDTHLSDIVLAMTSWRRDSKAVVHGKLLNWANSAKAVVKTRGSQSNSALNEGGSTKSANTLSVGSGGGGGGGGGGKAAPAATAAAASPSAPQTQNGALAPSKGVAPRGSAAAGGSAAGGASGAAAGGAPPRGVAPRRGRK